MNVYIDGACVHNGQPNAKAAYAVWFGHGDPRNESGLVAGKQSNNTGEITAFIRCLEIIAADDRVTDIAIHSDSEYVIKCATTYGAKLQAANWKTSTGKAPPNLDLVRKAYELFNNIKTIKKVKLNYIRAHTSNTDEHSIGNAEVDRMANSLVSNKASHDQDDAQPASRIIKLNIPFASKDKAKELGARWDVAKKHWYVNTKYVEQDAVEALIALQSEPEQPQDKAVKPDAEKQETKKYIKVSYANKDKAKKLGARWDAAVKSWYYVEEYITDEKKTALMGLS
jgi:ribonuclease HI